MKSLFRPRTFLTTCNTFSRTHCSYRNTQYGHITTLTKAKISLLLLRHLGEGSEGEGTLDLADVVLQDGLRGERLCQVEAVVNLERLTDRPLLGAGAHCARADPLCVSDLNPSPTNVAADTLFPQVKVDSRQG